MLKGAKTRLSDSEDNIVIMPSTRSGSAFINSLAALVFLALFVVVGYGTALVFFLLASWQTALIIAGSVFLVSRSIEFFTRNRKNRKGYIRTDRDNAKQLIAVEKHYAEMSKDDRELYKGLLEAAYYGEATPSEVVRLFKKKVEDTKQQPKPLDDLIKYELGEMPDGL